MKSLADTSNGWPPPHDCVNLRIFQPYGMCYYEMYGRTQNAWQPRSRAATDPTVYVIVWCVTLPSCRDCCRIHNIRKVTTALLDGVLRKFCAVTQTCTCTGTRWILKWNMKQSKNMDMCFCYCTISCMICNIIRIICIQVWSAKPNM